MSGFPQLVLGTMLFGTLVEERQAYQILDYFFENGYTHLDTAPIYPSPCSSETFGLTEQILGRYLALHQSTHLLSARVSTKFPNCSAKLPYARRISGPISYAEFCSAYTQSLERLSYCKVNAYFLHWPERQVNNFGKIVFEGYSGPASEQISNLDASLSELIFFASDAGIPTVGISNETPLGLQRLVSASKASSCNVNLAIQNPYNLLTPYFDIALRELCLYQNVPLYAHSPLAFGVLAGCFPHISCRVGRHAFYPSYFARYSRTTSNLLESLRDLSCALRISLEELAIRYVISNPAVSHILIGPRTLLQLHSCISSFRNGPLCKSIIDKINVVYASTPGFSF